jgi:hypothetical protein
LALAAVDAQVDAGNEGCAKSLAEARPIPLLPPVTTAVVPSSFRMEGIVWQRPQPFNWYLAKRRFADH